MDVIPSESVGGEKKNRVAYATRETAKYVGATATQYGMMVGVLAAIDLVHPPAIAAAPLFAFLSLRSRVFSLLDNSRPDRDAQDGKATPPDVKRPAWTPPGIAFPFIWLTITALRAASSAIVYAKTGALATPPLRAMALHLAIGDTWNTITNCERRLGVSAVGCLAVWGSVLRATLAYAAVSPVAAKVLAPSLAWISVACVLTTNIWLLNDKRPLYPSPDDGTSAPLRLANLLQLQPNSIGGRQGE
ncbi:hypothetical protein CTAYLR_008593 [Chrysophaeum taylorii]|uniref:Uncharacterized protein n=1 Tax=Chrysophaeum taylorii TaxID=2483200 RepID=A0AAD7UK87_9STRA|nr:hypothetical protein CTAYLR_008593 [Chrysophaeum taylorii]